MCIYIYIYIYKPEQCVLYLKLKIVDIYVINIFRIICFYYVRTNQEQGSFVLVNVALDDTEMSRKLSRFVLCPVRHPFGGLFYKV